MLTEILAAPDDDGPRLVYADWLTERGDPRGELIQVQCALAAGGLDDATRAALVLRERELLETHGRDWLLDMLGTMAEGIDIVGSAERPQLGSGASWHHRGAVAVFRRGFVEALKIPLARFGSADLGPLRCLVLTHASGRDDEQRIAGLVELPCLEALAFRASQLGQVGALALASSGIVRSVRALSLTSAWLDDAAAAALVAGGFSSLEELDLGGNMLRTRFAEALASAPWLSSLRALGLEGSYLGDEAAATIARATGWRVLRELRVDTCSLGDAGIASIASSARMSTLTHLSLSWNKLRDEGVRALAMTRMLRAIEQLDVRHCQLSSAALGALRRRWGGRLLVE